MRSTPITPYVQANRVYQVSSRGKVRLLFFSRGGKGNLLVQQAGRGRTHSNEPLTVRARFFVARVVCFRVYVVCFRLHTGFKFKQ